MKIAPLLAPLLVIASPLLAQTTPTAPVAAIDPARLAAAEKAVAALVPPGIYMTMMRDQMPRLMGAMMGRMLGKTPAEIGLPADPKQPAGRTLREAAAAEDPHFEERMRLGSQAMFDGMGEVFNTLEPRMRVGLGRAFARKFTLAQLNDMNAFFATPSGAAFAREYLLTFTDPELMSEMMAALPELMKAMPAIMAKAEKATAHLPPPPKKAGGDAGVKRPRG